MKIARLPVKSTTKKDNETARLWPIKNHFIGIRSSYKITQIKLNEIKRNFTRSKMTLTKIGKLIWFK